MDGNIAAYTAVLYDASLTYVVRNISRDAADILLTSDAGVGQSDVLDGSTRSPAEEALVAVSPGSATFVDADTADGMAAAIVGAAEVVVADTNAGKVVLGAGYVVPVGSVGENEVCHLQEGEADGFTTATHESCQSTQVIVAGDEVIAAVVGLEVVDGVGQVAVNGAEAVGGDAATCEAVASQVLNSTTKASDVQVTRSLLRDDGAEGQHVGAATFNIFEVTPVVIGSSAQRGCTRTRHLHNLTKRHRHIHRIASGMTARSHGNRLLGRRGAVHSLNHGSNILAYPVILIITTGVKAKDEGGESGRND